MKATVLSGGVGGARFLRGLVSVCDPDNVVIIGNVADDIEVLGLHVSPDLDSILYALAGLADEERGWGRADESWNALGSAEAFGGEAWFRLGDRDLALHVERTRRLKAGETLSQITADVCRRLGVATRVLPMSDDRVRTRVRSDSGWIDFQDYFVRQQCRPVVHELVFDGADKARAQRDVVAALAGKVRAVVICPSNPFISIEPILAVPGMRQAIMACDAPVVAVSPIVGGRAIKGPTAKMMQELGLAASAAAVAQRYGGLLDGFIVDSADVATATGLAVKTKAAATLMTDLASREALARAVLDFAGTL